MGKEARDRKADDSSATVLERRARHTHENGSRADSESSFWEEEYKIRRGAYLELQVGRLLKELADKGIHGHKNHAFRNEAGIYIEGEPFDYEIFANGILYAFDAKECHGKRWNLSNAKPRQIQSLKRLKNHGADAFFLVYYVPEGLRKFDVDIVIDAIKRGAKSLTFKEGVNWEWQTMLK